MPCSNSVFGTKKVLPLVFSWICSGRPSTYGSLFGGRSGDISMARIPLVHLGTPAMSIRLLPVAKRVGSSRSRHRTATSAGQARMPLDQRSGFVLHGEGMKVAVPPASVHLVDKPLGAQHLQPMQNDWPDIVASIRDRRLNQPDPSASAFGGVETLASFIASGPLRLVLYGWTSMFDLCIQQVDVEPFSGPHLRVTPLHSGRIEFRYVDTAIAQRQWHRETTPDAVVQRFTSFMDQLRWTRG